MTHKPSNDEILLDLIARDLDGDLDRAQRQELFILLAEREDAHMLLRTALRGDRAAAALRAACDSVPTPDLSASILDAVAGLAAREAGAGKPQPKGLWHSLKGALAGDRPPAAASRPQGGLNLSDLAGVVAGTGLSHHDEDSAPTGGNHSEETDTDDQEPR